MGTPFLRFSASSWISELDSELISSLLCAFWLYKSSRNFFSSAAFFCSLIILSIKSPIPFAAHPMCVSRTCPTFILDGTPSGLRTMSTGFPCSSYGISSMGIISEMTPLLPCLPAILSPGCILLFMAI